MIDLVTIDDLVVLEFKTERIIDETVEQWRESRDVLYSMSCAKQVWYGHRADFSNFPATDSGFVKRYEGKQAYAFLLGFACGFDEKKYDPHNIVISISNWTSRLCRDLCDLLYSSNLF